MGETGENKVYEKYLNDKENKGGLNYDDKKEEVKNESTTNQPENEEELLAKRSFKDDYPIGIKLRCIRDVWDHNCKYNSNTKVLTKNRIYEIRSYFDDISVNDSQLVIYVRIINDIDEVRLISESNVKEFFVKE